MTDKTKLYALAASGVVVLALGGTFAYTAMSQQTGPEAFAQCRDGAIAGSIGGPFELVREDGVTVTDQEVITEPSILYFGYTFCPDVCPLDTMRNAQAVDLLADEGVSATPIFVTIDPERDTLEVLQSYTDNFHDKMIGLTGNDAQISAASQAYRTYYRKVEDGEDDAFYLMDHSTFSYIVLPEYGFVDFVRREDTPEQVAERMACFAAASGV